LGLIRWRQSMRVIIGCGKSQFLEPSLPVLPTSTAQDRPIENSKPCRRWTPPFECILCDDVVLRV
jgi:hypothetical protein